MKGPFRVFALVSLVCLSCPMNALSAGAQESYARTSHPMIDTRGLPHTKFWAAPLQADVDDERTIFHFHPSQVDDSEPIDGMLMPLAERHVKGPSMGAARGLRTDMPMVGGLKQLPQAGFRSNMPKQRVVNSDLPAGYTTQGLGGNLKAWRPSLPAGAPTRGTPGRMPAAQPAGAKQTPVVASEPRLSGVGSENRKFAKASVSARLDSRSLKLLDKVHDN